MEVHIARDKETKTLIGIFVAKSIAELCGLIAEFTNPLACEVLKLETGGIFFQKKVSIIPPDLGDVTITDLWSQNLIERNDWMTINYSSLAALGAASSHANDQDSV